MKSIVLFSTALLMLCSCSNNADNTSNAKDTTVGDTTANVSTPIEAPECFAQAGKDTVLLQITTKNGAVNGTLYIHRDGKDMNQGHLIGDMKGDTLIADYTFYSEGVQSTRQIAFLKKNNAMIEGYGEAEEKENKMIFKNTTALKFEDKMKLEKVECTR